MFSSLTPWLFYWCIRTTCASFCFLTGLQIRFLLQIPRMAWECLQAEDNCLWDTSSSPTLGWLGTFWPDSRHFCMSTLSSDIFSCFLVVFCSCFPLDTIEFVLLQGRISPKMQKKKKKSICFSVHPSFLRQWVPCSSGDVCMYLYLCMDLPTCIFFLYPVPLWFKIATLCQSLLSHQRQVGLFWKVRGLFVLTFL